EAVEAFKREHRVEVRRWRKLVEEAGIALQAKLRFRAEDIDEPESVPSPDLEVVEVVRRRDLDGAGAFLGVGILIPDDRNRPADERQDRGLSDEPVVALVVRMHRDRYVAEHRLGARRRDRDEALGLAVERILDEPELPLDLDLLHLEVRDRGLEARVPVDEALVLVDKHLAVE